MTDAKERASVEIYNIDFLLLLWLNIVFNDYEREEKMGDNNVVRIDKYSKKEQPGTDSSAWHSKKWRCMYSRFIIAARCLFLLGVILPAAGIAAVFVASPLLGIILLVSLVASAAIIVTSARVEDWLLEKKKDVGGNKKE